MDKVTIYTGDDFLSLLDFKSLTQGSNVKSYDKDNYSSLSYDLSNDSILSYVIKVNNPNAEMLKIINESEINNPVYIFATNDTLDGRSALSTKAKKNNWIKNIPPVVSKDELKKFLSSYSSLKFSNGCLLWILDNCPTQTIKVKAGTSKKDLIIYDLSLLCNEIDKITSYKNGVIEIEDFSNSDFKKDIDIFLFIKDCENSKHYNILTGLYKLNESHGSQSLLMLLLYALFFRLNIVDNNVSLDKHLENISLSDLLNKYLSKDWEEIKSNLVSVNPVRVQISMNEKGCSSELMSKKINNVVTAIIDLRNNITEDIVYPRLALGLSMNVTQMPLSYER